MESFIGMNHWKMYIFEEICLETIFQTLDIGLKRFQIVHSRNFMNEVLESSMLLYLDCDQTFRS